MSSSEPKWTTPLYQIVQYVYILPWTQSAFTAPDPSQGSLYTSKRDKIKPNLMLSFLPNGIVSNRYRLFYFMEPDVITTVIPRMSITSVSIETSRFPAVASMGYFLSFFFEKDESGSSFVKLVYIVFGIIAPIAVSILQVVNQTTIDVANVLRWVFYPVPIFSLTFGYISMANREVIQIVKHLK